MKDKIAKQYIFTIVTIMFALAAMVVINFVSFYKKSTHDMIALGHRSLENETEQLRGYITKAENVLQATVVPVENMMRRNASVSEIEEFLTVQTVHYNEDVDENFTGIYGVFSGEYIDGSNWTPDEDYVPTERAWYNAAKEAGGEMTIVPPYLDAQTNTIVVSICQLLYDNESVISFDFYLNRVQEMIQDINFEGNGYGFIVDKSGLIIAHADESKKGVNYKDVPEIKEIIDSIYDDSKNSFDVTLNGERCTVFTENISDDWYVVMVVSNTKFFHEIISLIVRNIIVCLIVFIIIVVLCSAMFHKLKVNVNMLEESRIAKDRLNETIVETLARTIDAKDKYTNGHSHRVAKYAREIARRMGKTENEVREIYYAGLLHDVGKIHVPDNIINKPSKLDNEEFGYIKLHPIAGYHILKGIKETPSIALGAKWHHERFDGKGYPSGLEGKNIPEVARIICVADAYDAMTSYRSYRNLLPQEKVRKEFEKGIGTQFDPEIAQIMLQMIDEDTEYNMCQVTEFKKNILIVDDDSINMEFISFVLGDEPQYELIQAQSGNDALAVVEEQDIDIILLDIQMPNMDGFETYKRLREKTDAPIVFMSGNKDYESIKKATDIGCADYIVKPFLPKALKEIIHSVIQSVESE